METLFEDYTFLDNIERVEINITKGEVYIKSGNQGLPIFKNYKPTKETVDKLLDIVDKNKSYQNNVEEKTQLKLEENRMKLEQLQKMIESLNARLIDSQSVMPSV